MQLFRPGSLLGFARRHKQQATNSRARTQLWWIILYTSSSSSNSRNVNLHQNRAAGCCCSASWVHPHQGHASAGGPQPVTEVKKICSHLVRSKALGAFLILVCSKCIPDQCRPGQTTCRSARETCKFDPITEILKKCHCSTLLLYIDVMRSMQISHTIYEYKNGNFGEEVLVKH